MEGKSAMAVTIDMKKVNIGLAELRIGEEDRQEQIQHRNKLH